MDELNQHRQDFNIAGFNLPQLELAFIEALRCRSIKEKGYDSYLNETLKESVWLPRGMWDVAARASLPPQYRSAYLDLLQSAIESNEFGPLGDSRIHAILDPNYILYSGLMTRDITAWEKHLNVIKAQKQNEILKFRETIDAVLPSSKEIDLKNVMKAIHAIAEEKKLECVTAEKGRSPRVILRAEIADGISMYLEWSDLLALRKWGELQLLFIVQESERQIWAPGEVRSRPFVLGLGGMVPGGDWYCWKNGDWDSLVLGFLAHVEFLRICSNRP